MSALAGDVLAVDDEPVNLLLVEGLLTPLGYAVRTASDADAAVAELSRSRPDVVLLDVSMPGRDGLSLCRELRDDPATASLPVVLVTALPSTEHRFAGLHAGADDYLTKPIDEHELIARVRSMVARSRLHGRADAYATSENAGGRSTTEVSP